MVSNDVPSSLEESQIVASRLTSGFQCPRFRARTLLILRYPEDTAAQPPRSHVSPAGVCLGTSASDRNVRSTLLLQASSGRFGNVLVLQTKFYWFGYITLVVGLSRVLCPGCAQAKEELLLVLLSAGCENDVPLLLSDNCLCSSSDPGKGFFGSACENDEPIVWCAECCSYSDYRSGVSASAAAVVEPDVVRCDGVRLQGRMNTDGRAERTVTDSGYTSSYTISSPSTTSSSTTTSSTAPVTSDSSPPSSSSSSSSSSWHSAITAVVSLSEPRLAPSSSVPYGLRLGPAGFFRPPLTPLDQPPSQAARIYPPFDHGSLFSGSASSQFSPGFYPRLAHPRPSYSPAGVAMTPGLQQQHAPPPPLPQSPYLTPSGEPFAASSLIQIGGPLPHLIQQPQMQYPSYVVGSLGGDTIAAARHHVMAQHHHHHQQQQQQQQLRQQPSPLPPHRLTPAELFQRSPMMPEESPQQRGSRSPYKDDRPSHLLHPHTRGVGGPVGPRTLVYFSPPPLPALPHHVLKKHPADTGLAPSSRLLVKDPFGLARSSARGSVSREGGAAVPLSRGGPPFLSEPPPTPHRSPVAYSRGPTRSPVVVPLSSETRRPLTPPPPPETPSAEPQQPHYPPHFMRGSIIQLGSGRQKRVEELETRDFVDSAGISENLQIDSSTVVHMRQNHERNTVILGFSVGQQSIQVTVEATLEHPFFVYNQGWSSYSPERTRLRYGLTCHQLRVGNCCISLTQRDTQSPPAGATSSTPQHPSTYPSEPPRRASSSRPHRSPQISHALGAPDLTRSGGETTEGASAAAVGSSRGSTGGVGGPPSEQHSQSSEPHRGCSRGPIPTTTTTTTTSGIATHSVESFVTSSSSSSSLSSIPTRIPHLLPLPPPPPPVQLAPQAASGSVEEVVGEPRASASAAVAVASAPRGRKRRSSAPDVFHRSDNIPPTLTGEDTPLTGEHRRRSGAPEKAEEEEATVESPFQASSSSPEGS